MTRAIETKIKIPNEPFDQFNSDSANTTPSLTIVKSFASNRKLPMTRERMKNSFHKLRPRRDISNRAWFNWLCLGFLFIYLIIFNY